MQLYIGNKKNNSEDNQLTQLLTNIDFIKKVKYSSLYNVSESEYNEKGETSLKELDEYINQFINIDENLESENNH